MKEKLNICQFSNLQKTLSDLHIVDKMKEILDGKVINDGEFQIGLKDLTNTHYDVNYNWLEFDKETLEIIKKNKSKFSVGIILGKVDPRNVFTQLFVLETGLEMEDHFYSIIQDIMNEEQVA